MLKKLNVQPSVAVCPVRQPGAVDAPQVLYFWFLFSLWCMCAICFRPRHPLLWGWEILCRICVFHTF